jgi:hypothetical protein
MKFVRSWKRHEHAPAAETAPNIVLRDGKVWVDGRRIRWPNRLWRRR